MNYLILDVETTTSNKGNPFDTTNQMCYLGILNPTEKKGQLYDIEYTDSPYRDHLREVQTRIDATALLVGFNIKFDLHWIRKYGINFSTCRIWDCQLVHFILTGQKHSYPSLNDVATHYGLATKLDVVSNVYWKNGISTKDIPVNILTEYLEGDLQLTYQVYLKQLEELETKLHLRRLISLHNQDLLILQEMEFNGLLFNIERSNELAYELEKQIRDLDIELFQYHLFNGFNPNSIDHLSALLYGGSIRSRHRVSCGTFKTGNRAGEEKTKWEEYVIELPRIVTPLRGSELAKDGLFSTDEQTLRSLKGSQRAKKLIDLLLKRAELEKRVSTYYRGLITLHEEQHWEPNKLHGQLNQCVARTGRLSSSKPNLQNFDGEIKELFYSRYS